MPEISLQQLSLENPDTVVLCRHEWQELLDCSIALDSAIRNDCHHGGPDAELMVAVNCRLQCFVSPVQKRLDACDDLREKKQNGDAGSSLSASVEAEASAGTVSAGQKGTCARKNTPRSRSCQSHPNS